VLSLYWGGFTKWCLCGNPDAPQVGHRFTMKLSEALHTKFKIACTLEGTDRSGVVRSFMEAHSEKAKKRKPSPHSEAKKK